MGHPAFTGAPYYPESQYTPRPPVDDQNSGGYVYTYADGTTAIRDKDYPVIAHGTNLEPMRKRNAEKQDKAPEIKKGKEIEAQAIEED